MTPPRTSPHDPASPRRPQAPGSDTVGCRLRVQRLTRGWVVAELGRRLCMTAKTTGACRGAGIDQPGLYETSWDGPASSVSVRQGIT